MSVDIFPTPFATISLNYDAADLSEISKNRTDYNSYDHAALSFRSTIRYRGGLPRGDVGGVKTPLKRIPYA